MALKAVVDSIDAVPENLRDLYAERDGKFVLAIDGALPGFVPKATVDEFRTNNVGLKKTVEELTARFDGIDPEKARAALAQEQAIADKKLIEAGKVDELVASRTAGLARDHARALEAARAETAAIQTQLHTHVVQGDLRNEAMKLGVLPAALDDVILRGDRVFRVVDGKPAAFDGDEAKYGKDGTALRPAEWIAGLRETAPHLFAASTGGGARPNAGAQTPLTGNKVSASDHRSFLANLGKITSGEVEVVG